MKIYTLFFVIIICFTFTYNSYATSYTRVTAKTECVLISASVQDTPKPKITLSWAKNDLAKYYRVYRKDVGLENDWNFKIKLDTNTFTFVDSTVVIGKTYEYMIDALCFGAVQTDTTAYNYYAYGYICSGIDVPAPKTYGTVLLVVDETMNDALSTELYQWTEDLISEGWGVTKIKVARQEAFDGQAAKDVKSKILAEYNKDPDNVNTVFLFGRVAVPYSGYIYPDRHPNHHGAWPADLYYGCLDETVWTDDVLYDTTSAIRAANRNGIGDGKFDQSSLGDAQTQVDLAVGRVDLYNMPTFALSETELLRNYLKKDHNYRTGNISYENKGLVVDNFSAFSLPEGFATSGFRNLSVFFGSDNIKSADWFTTLKTNSYLWAYACGGGSDNTLSDSYMTTEMFDTIPVKAIFTMLFGSYFGDWNVQNNLLRAPLASSPSALTCVWAGRPAWYFHHMGMGYPIGYSTKLSQNNDNNSQYQPNSFYTNSWPGNQEVHIALMGDPTLRMYMGNGNDIMTTVTNLSCKEIPTELVELTWDDNNTNIAGYHVYRASKYAGPYSQIDSNIVTDKKFIDSNIFGGAIYYIVKPVRLEVTNASSFYNTGRGAKANIVATVGVNEYPELQTNISCNPNPAITLTNISVSISEMSNTSLAIYDMNGNCVKDLCSTIIMPGTHSFSWNLTNSANNRVSPGVYFVKLSTNGEVKVQKIVVLP